MTRLDDIQLYRQAIAHDRQSFEQLYDRYEKLVFSFAYRMTNNQTMAEEITQDVFLKMWNGTNQYAENKGKFSSWLLTVTRNKSIDAMRKAKRHSHEQILDKDSLTEQAVSTEVEAEWNERRETIQTAIAELRAEQREIIDLFYFKGFSQSKIAEHCKLPLGTVKGRIRLALKHLKVTIGQEGGVSNE